MKTWNLVDLPGNGQPLTCRWISRQKQDVRFKARLVARSFEHKEGSPISLHVSIRLILSLAASNQIKLMNFDVKAALLYGFNDDTDRV